MEKLILGTAQWGMAYGVSNTTGVTPPDEVARILSLARQLGCTKLDTAAQYGGAETFLGKHGVSDFELISKTPRDLTIATARETASRIAQAAQVSIERLGVTKLNGYLLHSADNLCGSSGPWIADGLCELKASGLAEFVGVSVYDSEQIRRMLALFTPDIVQLPLNVLDQRLIADGTLQELSQKGVKIHVRSIFLQGLLLMPLESLDPYFAPLLPLLRRWHDRLDKAEVPAQEAALSFVVGLSEVDRLVVGVQSAEQLHQIATVLETARSVDTRDLASIDTDRLDPRKWKIA